MKLLFFMVYLIHAFAMKAHGTKVDIISPEATSSTSFRGVNGIYVRAAASYIETPPSRSVKLPLGMVKGISCSTDATVTRFLGIPFGDTPVGKNRFKPATKYTKPYPKGELQATLNPPPCGSLCSGSVRDSSSSAEDCLFLNIWVPLKASVEKVPVRVYIHGGDLMDCSASDPQWDGCQTASKENIIHINIQFRMGVFGMLSHPLTFTESKTTGNWGLLDQQLALQWIQDHIHYFGGDPLKVVLNGHSRGGQMVDFQMVARGSEGLFASAISQSAPCVHFRTLDQGYADTKRFMEAVKCSPNVSPEAELDCMRDLSWNYLVNMTRSMQNGRPLDILWCDRHDWEPTFHHVVDGEVVPLQVLDAYKAGKFNKVPYVSGMTTQEAGGLGSFFFLDDVNEECVDNFIKIILPNASPGDIKSFYDIQHFQDSPDPLYAQLAEIWSDFSFVCPIHQRIAARASNANSSTYLYWWGVTPSCPPESMYMGPTHGTDLWYTFGETSGFTSQATPSGTCGFDQAEIEVSRNILFVHHSMAESGSPLWVNGTKWPLYDAEETGTYINIGEFSMRKLTFKDRCDVLFQAKQLP